MKMLSNVRKDYWNKESLFVRKKLKNENNSSMPLFKT